MSVFCMFTTFKVQVLGNAIHGPGINLEIITARQLLWDAMHSLHCTLRSISSTSFSRSSSIPSHTMHCRAAAELVGLSPILSRQRYPFFIFFFLARARPRSYLLQIQRSMRYPDISYICKVLCRNIRDCTKLQWKTQAGVLLLEVLLKRTEIPRDFTF